MRDDLNDNLPIFLYYASPHSNELLDLWFGGVEHEYLSHIPEIEQFHKRYQMS